MTDTQAPEAETDLASCSFCGKSQTDVKKLIAGPAQIYICDECVGLCVDIISEEDADQAKPSEEQLAAAWAGMLKNRARAAETSEALLAKTVRQARAKGLEWDSIAESLGVTAAEAESRFDLP